MKLRAFGIAKDIMGSATPTFDEMDGQSVFELKEILLQRYPELGSIKTFHIAVNQELALGDYVISTTDEVAIIPPVSGG